MNCGGCGHSIDFHGRRGHGSCRRLEPTSETRAKIEEWNKTMSPEAVLRLAECLFHLGGATGCDCKRFRKTAKVPAPEPTT